ncbi:MAG TPA: DUF4276 family protein [Planctomycetota bacterium]|nr:DUF4276 family protein [Planctomycetota bacterium]
MNSLRLGVVVEGYGEMDAVPTLIHRIAGRIAPSLRLDVPRPIRQNRSKVVKQNELERAVQMAAHAAGTGGAVLVLLDGDGDPPCVLGPELLARAHRARSDMPGAVVIAHQEFETWFLFAARSIRKKCGLPDDLEPPEDPEGIRDAKGWLAKRMPRGRTYSPTVDQKPLASAFDLDAARACSSFDKLWRELERLLCTPAA